MRKALPLPYQGIPSPSPSLYLSDVEPEGSFSPNVCPESTSASDNGAKAFRDRVAGSEATRAWHMPTRRKGGGKANVCPVSRCPSRHPPGGETLCHVKRQAPAGVPMSLSHSSRSVDSLSSNPRITDLKKKKKKGFTIEEWTVLSGTGPNDAGTSGARRKRERPTASTQYASTKQPCNTSLAPREELSRGGRTGGLETSPQWRPATTRTERRETGCDSP